MMKMATGDGFPLRQGAGTGSREVFGGYRGLPRRNSRSRLFSGGFSLYGNFWRRSHVRGVSGLSTRQGARPPPGRALHPCGPLMATPTDFFFLYIPIYPKNIEDNNRSGVPPPQASVATKNLSGACFGTLPEGDPITGGHLHHLGALHDKEGLVHPRG